jgi:phage-related protein
VRVEFFRSQNGAVPVRDFLEELGNNPKLRAKVFRSINLLEQFGSGLPGPHAASIVGRDFRELRIRQGSNIARIFFVAHGEDQVVLLHGFLKKTQKTPLPEIKTAQRRLDELMGRRTRNE